MAMATSAHVLERSDAGIQCSTKTSANHPSKPLQPYFGTEPNLGKTSA